MLTEGHIAFLGRQIELARGKRSRRERARGDLQKVLVCRSDEEIRKFGLSVTRRVMKVKASVHRTRKFTRGGGPKSGRARCFGGSPEADAGV